MSRTLRCCSRIFAYLIALLLAVVWLAAAGDTLLRPLFDIGRAQVGEIVVAIATAAELPSRYMVQFAHLLAGLKFMVGAFLVVALLGTLIEKLRFGTCDEAMFDVALFVAALATIVGALPGLAFGGELLQGAIGEMILCVAASGLAIYGRGYLIKEELPRPVRPPFGYAR